HENVVNRFLEMGHGAVALKHPNIVSVFEVGTDEDTPFVAMEWVEWPTLAKILSLEASLPPWRVAEIGAEIASALTYAHGHGVLHRGPKPTDIFISPNGDVKVADFGMARVTEHVADLDARTALLAA